MHPSCKFEPGDHEVLGQDARLDAGRDLQLLANLGQHDLLLLAFAQRLGLLLQLGDHGKDRLGQLGHFAGIERGHGGLGPRAPLATRVANWVSRTMGLASNLDKRVASTRPKARAPRVTNKVCRKDLLV